MKRAKKSVISALAMVLVLCLALGLAGCGENPGPAPTTDPKPTEAPTSPTTPTPPAETEPAKEINMENAVLSFSGESLTVVCYYDFSAKIYDSTTKECKLETTFSYTRTKTAGAGGMSGYTFGEDELEGPVIYLHYPEVYREDGINACARSVLTASGMTLAFDHEGISDTFVIPEEVYSVLNSGEKILTFTGYNTPYEFIVEFYEGGFCSTYASRDGAVDEITPGRHKGNPEIPYGGGEEANNFVTGFWKLDEDPNGVIEVGDTSYTLTVNWDGIVVTGEVTANGSLGIHTDFAMSAYKKSANNTAPRAAWQRALLGVAAEKVVFEGIDNAIICLDDEEQSVKVINIDDAEEIYATGTWSFDEPTLTITVTLEDGTVMVSEPGDDGRINMTYQDDVCESGFNWKAYFVEAEEEVHPGNVEEYSVENTAVLEPNAITGKTIFFLGSSVTYGEKSDGEAMGEFIAKRNGCTAIKEAISGTTLAHVNNSMHQDDSYVKRLEAYLAGENCAESIDAFVCQLSTNDVGGRCEKGQVTANDVKDKAAFDITTTYGAMEYIIALVQEKWGCPVIFYSNSYFESKDYNEMITTAKSLADKWDNVIVIDLYNDADFNDISDEDLALYMVDSKHPSKAGYREWWVPAFEKTLSDLFS